VTDGFSRFLLGCQALSSTSVREAKPVFARLFKEFGLPRRIRTDNGVHFATNTLARLSQLSAWWVRLGIVPEFIEPGKPRQNGRHEFNFERPHEALDQQTPASLYEASTRPMPTKLPPLECPDRFEERYVSANGGIRWNKQWVNVSTVCAGEYVGIEEIDDGLWNVYFGPLTLGRLIERQMRIEDAFGCHNRKILN
jgi:putative transposase